MKRSLSILSLLLLGSTLATAQSFLGLRTGINYEMANKKVYRTSESLNTLSWSQQLFWNKTIGSHFLLEINVSHHQIKKDLSGKLSDLGNTGTYKINNHIFNNCALLSYKIAETKQLSLYAGLGLGTYLGSESSEGTSLLTGYSTGESNTFTFQTFYANAALTLVYPLNKHFNLSAQGLYSKFLYKSAADNLSLHIGAAYQI